LGGSAFYTLTVGAASGFPATCSINVVNADTSRGKAMAINGITFPLNSILWPGMSFSLKNISNTWTIVGLPTFWKITTGITYNVDTASGSDSSDCLGSMGTTGACATLAHAVSQFCQTTFTVGAAQVTFQLKTGQSHPQQTFCLYGADNFIENNTAPLILGDATSCTNAANYQIAGLSDVGFYTPWTISGVALTSNLGVDNHAHLNVSTNTVFGAVTGITVHATYLSFIEFIGNFCITGGSSVFAGAEEESEILAESTVTVTISNTPAFSVGFLQVVNNGFQLWNSVTFSGSATGPQVNIPTGGGISSLSTTLPGNSQGAVQNPGWFYY
jgi:hypothetical protein